jgi:hypothetical protein
MWATIAAVWLAWAAGRLAALVEGKPLAGPDFGPDFAAGVVTGQWSRLWPGINPAVVAAVYGVLVTLSGGGLWWLWGWWQLRRPDGEDPLPSLADRRAVQPLTRTAVAAKARRLRPSLAAAPTSLIAPVRPASRSACIAPAEHSASGADTGTCSTPRWRMSCSPSWHPAPARRPR